MDSHGDTNTIHNESDSVDIRGGSVRSDLSGLYHLGRTLGRGHFAVVKLARHVNTGQLVAVKMIDKTKLDVMATSHLLQEVRCMRRVQHPNVVRLYEVIDTPTTLYLIMELAEGGDLYDYILRHEGGVAESTAKRHFAQIVRAVAYCHQLHVVHRDLKPENVVFFPQQGAVKLTDFGFSNLFKPGMMLATSCGSLAYSAPEILLGEEYDAPAVDIWSLGVILYMLVCGVPPFQETNDSETLVMILDCRYSVPEHVSDQCKDLIARMLQKDPSHRASLQQVEAHQWLQGLDDALLSPEAPPSWLSGALSPTNLRPGVPESGDLLAARPPPLKAWRPSLKPSPHPPPPEEPLVAKPLAALQQICEEGEEEEEEEEDDLAEEGEGSSSQPLLMAERTRPSTYTPEKPERGQEKNGMEVGPAVGSVTEVMEEEEEEEERMETAAAAAPAVILEQPSSEGHKPVARIPEPMPAPPTLGGRCCRGERDPEGRQEDQTELNNNTNKPQHVLGTGGASLPRPSPTAGKEAARTGRDGTRQEPKAEEGERDGVQTDRAPPHGDPASREAGPDAAARAESGKRHSLKLRERLFQFPLCEKALAFNIPTHKKSKILPLAQYNCCHVL